MKCKETEKNEMKIEWNGNKTKWKGTKRAQQNGIEPKLIWNMCRMINISNKIRHNIRRCNNKNGNGSI